MPAFFSQVRFQKSCAARMVRITEASSAGVKEDAEARIASSLGPVSVAVSTVNYQLFGYHGLQGLQVTRPDRFGIFCRRARCRQGREIWRPATSAALSAPFDLPSPALINSETCPSCSSKACWELLGYRMRRETCFGLYRIS